MYDPFQAANPFRQDPSDMIGDRQRTPAPLRAPRPGAKFPSLGGVEADDEKDSLLHRTLSGLHYAGSVLDKTFGGRAVRGALTGKAREVASVIPFSDSLGITDYDKDNTTGEDVLKHYGYDPSKGNWAERNLAGPAAEIALDPGTYLSFGGKHAATALGRIAHGLGETKGFTHRQLLEGFTHTQPELMDQLLKSGRSAVDAAGDIEHMRAGGARIASEDLVNAALAQGHQLKAGDALAGAAGIGLPFGQARYTFGHGDLAQKYVGAWDKAKDAVKFAPGVKNVRALLSPAAGRSDHAGVQQAFEQFGRPTREGIESQIRAGEHTLRTKFDEALDAGQHIPGAEREAARIIRGSAENAGQFKDLPTWEADYQRRLGLGLATHVADPNGVLAHIRGQYKNYQNIGNQVRQFGEQVSQQSGHLGLSLQDLNDRFADYAARRYIGASPAFQGSPESKLLQTQHASNLHRKSGLSNIAGGSEQLNDWAMDARLVGPAKLDNASRSLQIAEDMKRNYFYQHGVAAAGNELRSINQKAGHVRQWLDMVNENHVAHQIPYYNPDLIGDYTMRGMRHAQAYGAGDVLLHGAANMARPIGDFAPGSGHVPLNKFLTDNNLVTTSKLADLTPAEEATIQGLGLGDRGNLNTLADEIKRGVANPAHEAAYKAFAAADPQLAAKLDQSEHYGAMIQLYQHMAQHGFGDVRQAISGNANYAHDLAQHALSQDDAQALSRFMTGWHQPGELKPFFEFMRGGQNFFKNMVYPLWPASHMRNFTSALYNNWIDGTPMQAYHDAYNVLKGHGLDHADYGAHMAAMSPAERAVLLKRGAYADAKVFGGADSFHDTVGANGLEDAALHRVLQGQGRMIPRAPGTPGESLGTLLTKNGWGGLNPFGQEGMGGGWLDRRLRGKNAAVRTEDTFAPLLAGRQAGTNIEDFVRMAHYLGGLRKGMNSAQAGARTRALHFDYSDITPGEQSLKNIIPFYTYMRKNLPMQLQTMAERPSAIAPMLHGLGNASGSDWLPDQLASGVAIPLGEEQDGTRRYLSKLGLPFEEALERLKFRKGTLPGGHEINLPDFGKTALSYAGSLNPYVKGILENMTDTQFHSGRRLSDLHAKGLAGGYGLIPEEYAQPLSQIVANSPFARAASTIDKFADPRKSVGIKAMNFFTGLKTTDADMDKSRAIAGRQMLTQALHANPQLNEFTNFYPDPEQAARLTPETVRDLRLFTLFKGEAKKHKEAEEAKKRLREIQGLNAVGGQF